MKATATQIGNSSKERIELENGTVVRKSVDIGKYTHLCLYYRDDNENPYIGACKSRENAEKYQPYPAVRDLYPAKKSDSQEEKDRVRGRYFALKEKYGKPTKHHGRSRFGRSSVWCYRFSVPFRREIVEIER